MSLVAAAKELVDGLAQLFDMEALQERASKLKLVVDP